MPTMRLRPQHIAAIKEVVAREAGPDARVRLFGSRLDDSARGGDIDLLVELPAAADNAPRLEARVAAGIERLLGEQRIDVLVTAPNLAEQPIHRVARQLGQLL